MAHQINKFFSRKLEINKFVSRRLEMEVPTKTQKLDRYEGKWVAFMGKQVVAHHETLRDLMKEVDARGMRKKVSVFLVPRKDEGPYILLEL